MTAASGGSPIVQTIGIVVAGFWVIGGVVYRRRQRTSDAHDAPVEGVDPGWGPVFARATLVIGAGRKTGADPLTGMRLIFVALETALILFLFVFSFSTPWSSGDPGIAPWVAVAVGLLSLVGISWVRRRPFNATSEERLAGQFRTAMFLGIGIGEIPALIALLVMLIANSLWIYLIGLGLSLLDLTLIGPTKREIARRQRQIVAAHQPHDLTRALMRRPEPPTPSEPS